MSIDVKALPPKERQKLLAELRAAEGIEAPKTESCEARAEAFEEQHGMSPVTFVGRFEEDDEISLEDEPVFHEANQILLDARDEGRPW